MKFKPRRRHWIAVTVLVGILLMPWIGVRWLAESLVSPPRRVLQDYHHAWLNDPTAHAIEIKRVAALNGDAPCLLVTPIAVAPSQRGQIIRRQLADMGQLIPAQGETIGTVVLLHGRKGRKEDLLPVADRFCAAGLRCILPDLPAHGESPLATVHFATIDSEAEFAWKVLLELAEAGGFEHQPAAIWGMSMGGAFAARSLSHEGSDWRCAIIVSSFDSLEEVIREQSTSRAWILGRPLGNAVTRSLRNRHDLDPGSVRPIDWIATTTTPVLIAHGTTDPLFSIDRGQALFDALPGPEKKWIEVEGGDHDNVLITPMPLYATMAAWILEHLTARP